MKDTVFQQILKPLTKKLMNECLTRFQSDYHYETFKTYEHLQAMIYAHINEIKSLRTLEVALNSQKLGIRAKIKRSTLSDANAKRPAECFFWILEQLMLMLPRKKHKEIKKVIRILDSSPIQLKGQGYDGWSKQYATRHIQGLKLHVEYDLTLKSPSKVATSHPNFNDSSMGRQWPILKDTIYVFDKGYYDYNWWWSIHQKQAYFVTRLKINAAIIIEKQSKTRNKMILEDGLFRISNKVPRGGKRMKYTETLRRISVKREGKKPLILVTNIKDLPAENIAALYKARWEIELFFKWVKQNLKLKKFLGKSANAVKIQIATALIAYLLIQIFKACTNDHRSLRLVLTWARYNLQASKPHKVKQKPPTYHFPKRTWQTYMGSVHL
jgi:putative transposase